MPVPARRPLRRMRGGAQAWLMEAEDGHHYVVKFTDNPQHRRVLVNEWIAGVFLDHLRIARPETRVIELDERFLAAHPELYIALGASHQPVSPGWHFGSRFPGNPLTQAVYDYLPRQLLPKLANLRHFHGILAFDKWTANADSRQAIFFRAKLAAFDADSAAVNPLQVGFVAQMIDHGYLFDGSNWEFHDGPLRGVFRDYEVYAGVDGLESFEPWLSQIVNMPLAVFDRALREIPASWLPGGDAAAIENLLETLFRRRARLADLIAESRSGSVNPFPHWAR